ncbi:MAG: Ubiquinol-cytochrome C reductase iron-sulfur subunit, partial [uncultured Nocardioidaceae bacterium]
DRPRPREHLSRGEPSRARRPTRSGPGAPRAPATTHRCRRGCRTARRAAGRGHVRPLQRDGDPLLCRLLRLRRRVRPRRLPRGRCLQPLPRPHVGVGPAAHRHRRDPLGAQAHGRPRDDRDAAPVALERRGPCRDARGAAGRHRRVRHRAAPADPQLAARRHGCPRAPAGRLAARPRSAAGRRADQDRVDRGDARRQRRRRDADQARVDRDRPADQRRARRLLPPRGVRRGGVPRRPPQPGEGKGGSDRRPDAPRGHHSGRGPGELGDRRDPRLLQDLHPCRVPDLPVGAVDPPPVVSLPPVHLRPRRQRQGHLRAGCPGASPAPPGRRRRGLPDRHQRLHRAGGPELLGTRRTM